MSNKNGLALADLRAHRRRRRNRTTICPGTGLSAPVTIDCATKALDMPISEDPGAHRHDRFECRAILPGLAPQPRSRHSQSSVKYRVALNAESLQHRRPGCAGIPRTNAGRAALAESLVQNQLEVPLPLSDIRWSTFDARLRIWSGFEVNTQGPPAFLLFVRGTTK